MTSIFPVRLFAFSVFMFYLADHAFAETKETSPPNIVFILADDLGYRELGSFGQEKIQTPNIDRLAAEGMKLMQHYSGNAVCAPSRCVLVTGKHPGHAYVRDNKSTPPEGQYPIPESEVTIFELLAEQGYATGAFGKWGLGGPASSGEPLNQGVDRFFGYNCQAKAHTYFPEYLWSDRDKLFLTNKPAVSGHAKFGPNEDVTKEANYEQFAGTDYAPDRINEQALEFIRTHQDEPFFLYYPSIIPHLALHVPEEDLKPYRELGWNDPPFTKAKGFGYTPHFTPRAAYAAMITKLDQYVGNVLALLEELELAENTLVIFTSDNGTTHLGDEVDYEFFNSVGELRGLKGSLYEGGVRVPTVVRWPGQIEAGSESDRISGFEDWLPTVLDAVGASDSTPNQIDGISLVPTLTGEVQQARPYLYREFPGYGGQQSIRVGDWKAIRQNMRRGNLEIELYNLADDVSEQNNVAAEHPDVVAKLEKMMQNVRVPSELFPLPGIDPKP